MLLTIKDLTLQTGAKTLLKDAKIVINEKDKIGIIGKNGNGKSTFLKAIANLDIPSGCYIKGKNYKVNYVDQEVKLIEGDTPFSYISRNLENEEIEDYMITSILYQLGIENINDPMENMSGGQKKRVSLALGLIKPCDLLILDEPTNHLDYEMITFLEKKLMEFTKAILMVTHDRYFLEKIVNRIVEIDFQDLNVYEANYTKYLLQKQDRITKMLAQESKRKKFLRKEIQWVHAGCQARTTKQKARLENFEALSNIDDIVLADDISFTPYYTRLGGKTIELDDICYSIDSLNLVDHFSYNFNSNSRIGIVGKNGIGKTTLLKLIVGQLLPDAGKVTIGETVKIGYFSQENEFLDYNMKVFDFVKEINHDNDGLSSKQLLEDFLFDENSYATKIESLSGGEKRRLSLIATLIKKPNVLLLDEPTNDLDIPTLNILEKYLSEFQGIIITVSHDRYFLDNIVDTTFYLEGNGKIKVYPGAYYKVENHSVKKNEKPKKEYVKQKKLKMTYKEQKEFETIDEKLMELEEQLKEIEVKMNQQSDNYNLVMELVHQQKELEKQLEETTERWIYLNELNEAING